MGGKRERREWRAVLRGEKTIRNRIRERLYPVYLEKKYYSTQKRGRSSCVKRDKRNTKPREKVRDRNQMDKMEGEETRENGGKKKKEKKKREQEGRESWEKKKEKV